MKVQGFYGKYFKRVIDLFFAFIGLIIASPLILIIALLIVIMDKNSPFFFQSRPGKNCKVFKVVKFKTMRNLKDGSGNLLPDRQRITKLGRFLRKTSLDEIPQFWNIFKGEMSFIGPRPLAMQYIPYYTEHEMTRHAVRPGITGLAQINGRNSITWEEKFEHDVCYVSNLSFLLDISIAYKTVLSVIKQKDVSNTGVDSPGNFDTYRKNQIENLKTKGSIS